MQKKSQHKQKVLCNSEILFIIFSTLIVSSVDAEGTTNNEKSSAKVATSTTKEAETDNKKQPIGEAPTDDVSHDLSHLFLLYYKKLKAICNCRY